MERVLREALAAVPGRVELDPQEAARALELQEALTVLLGVPSAAPARERNLAYREALARALVLAARYQRAALPPGAREQAQALARVLVAQVPGAPLALVEWAQQVVAAALLDAEG